jgi:hypothetical protein
MTRPGDIVFQGTREAVGETDLVPHEAPAVFHTWLQRTHRDTLRGEDLEFVPVFEQQFELEFRIGGVILGSAGREGFAVCGHRQRVDGEEHQKVMGAQRGHQGPCGQLQADGDRPPAEAVAERARPRADRLRRVRQHTGFSGVGTRDLRTDRV